MKPWSPSPCIVGGSRTTDRRTPCAASDAAACSDATRGLKPEGSSPLPGQPMGQRLVVNCTGGSVHGLKINGTVIPPTGDWLFPLGEGHLRLDVRGTIKTDDGELILFEYYGMISFPKEAFDRALKGEVVTAKDGYFITAPIFTTAFKKYPWLTEILAVGKMTSLQAGKYVVWSSSRG